MNNQLQENKMHIGWREWAELPDLSVPAIKVKIDTGAATSAIHAFNIRPHNTKSDHITFEIHPLQKNRLSIPCQAKLVDMRTVKSSNGQSEKRYIINTSIRIGFRTWKIDVSLTNRDLMTYRMLLGRAAMEELVVEPEHSYVQGKMPKKVLRSLYPI